MSPSPAFTIRPNAAQYSSGKLADLYYRENPLVSQVAVLEADDVDEAKKQFRVITVINGRGMDSVGKGGYSKEACSRELLATANEQWLEANTKAMSRDKSKDTSR